MKFLKVILVILLVGSGTVKAQELESYPASIKWWQINTPHFKVIYPSNGERQASIIANSLEQFYEPAASTLGVLPRKIRIVVNNKTSVSNGFVSMAPRRSEIYTAPPQDFNLGGSNQWLPFVSLHEYRHVVQYQRSYAGFSKLSYLLFGPEAFNVMAFLSVPIWLWEGDAVVAETAMSKSGRGRIPEFNIEFRTPLVTREKPYSYNKQYLGSYKDYIPDHYRIGYYMSAYLREKYGKNIWNPIIRQANAHSFLPFTFSIAMKKNTGKFLLPTYREMTAQMKKRWSDKLVPEEEAETISPHDKIFTNYLYPQSWTDEQILVVREGLGDIQQFVSVSPDGNVKRIFTPGVMNRSPMVSSKKGFIVWTEYVPDNRWPKIAYSSIKIYNSKTREVNILTTKKNYASADLSNDLSKIISVQTTEEGLQKLTILHSHTGEIIKELPNKDNATFQQPRFTEDDSGVVAVKLTDKGKSIVIIDEATGKESVITAPSFENVGYPISYQNWILYNSPYNGVDNIYAIDITTGEKYQVTEGRFGAYNPLISSEGKFLYFNLFTEKGMSLVRKEFKPDEWTRIEGVKDRNINLADVLSDQEDKKDLANTIPDKSFESKRYRRVSGIFTPTSWGPYLDATTSQLFVGVRSQDILSNFAWEAGYIYDNTEETESWKGSVTYHGIYTPISSSINYGKRYESAAFLQLSDTTIQYTDLSWYETEVETGLSLPINFTNGKNFTYLTIENSISYIHKEGYNNPNEANSNILILPVSQGNGNLIANNFSLLFSRLWRRSKRDINSKFGQYFMLRASGALGGDFTGSITTLRAGAYFPGIFKHHSLFVKGGYQSQNLSLETDYYRFRNQIEFPRGFDAVSFETYTYGSVNYALPLLYPDFAIGPLVYIQRIKTNLFFDFAQGSRTISGRNIRFGSQVANYRSAGLELTFDFNLFRLPYPFEAGVRLNYKNDPFGVGEDPFSYEFLIASFGF